MLYVSCISALIIEVQWYYNAVNRNDTDVKKRCFVEPLALDIFGAGPAYHDSVMRLSV